MVDRKLKQDFHRVMTSMFGEDGAQQRRTVQAVIRPDATVGRDSFLPVLPWFRADVMLPGAVVVDAANVRMPFPQGAIIRHISLSARGAPSGGPCTIRFSVTGGGQETFSLQAGTTTRMTGVTLTVPTGGWLTGAVTASNDAHDVLITVHYTVGGA